MGTWYNYMKCIFLQPSALQCHGPICSIMIVCGRMWYYNVLFMKTVTNCKGQMISHKLCSKQVAQLAFTPFCECTSGSQVWKFLAANVFKNKQTNSYYTPGNIFKRTCMYYFIRKTKRETQTNIGVRKGYNLWTTNFNDC